MYSVIMYNILYFPLCVLHIYMDIGYLKPSSWFMSILLSVKNEFN